MTQQETLQSMSPLPWRIARIIQGKGMIKSKDNLFVLRASFEHNEGMCNDADICATTVAVNATFGSGILPEEVEEMVTLMQSMADGIRASDIQEMNDLLTRINSRKK